MVCICVLTALGVSTRNLSAQAPPNDPNDAQRRAQRPNPGHPPPVRPSPRPAFGNPLPGLTTEQQSDFAAGLEEFTNEETPETGLGPIYNNVSCAACHSHPSVGGSSDIFVTRFGRNVQGHFDPLTELGGSLLQRFAIDPAAQEVVPRQANVIAHRQTTPLYGLGLIEAIPDNAILRQANQPKPDGVRGRAAMITDVVSGQLRVGKFGWKAQQATLLAFAGDAYLNEMGITNPLFPTENAPNGRQDILALFDHFADPEDADEENGEKTDIEHAADFMRLLAPPPQPPPPPSMAAGSMLFHQVGCTSCHTPSMTTGPSQIAALDHKAVNLYSDLLLHDMGSLGDGIAQADAGTREMRTPPLWGLRSSAPYLHDGRAANVHSAITAHDGEAALSRSRYMALPLNQRQQLLDFLNSL